MVIKQDYALQSIADQHFIFMRNDGQVDLTHIISLNNSAAWLWTQLEKRDFTCEEAATLLAGHFDVSYSVALADVHEWCDVLAKNNLIQE